MTGRVSPPPRGPRRWGVAAILILLVLCLPSVVAAGAHTIGASASPAVRVAADSGRATSPTPVGWSTFHGSENRSGYFAGPGPASTATRWVSCPSNVSIQVGPVLNATRVFLTDDLGTVLALDRQHNGSVVWRQSLGTTPTTADLTGSTLLVGSGDGFVTALYAPSGAELWSKFVGGRVEQGIAVDNGTVFASLSNGNLVALSLSDGKQGWVTAVGGPMKGAPTILGGIVYVATSNGTLVAVSEAGSILWSRTVGAPVESAVAGFNRTLVVGDLSGNVSAFSVSGGTLLWRVGDHIVGDQVESTPALTSTTAYVATDLGGIFALDLSNGSLRWSHQVAYSGYPVLASPVATPTGVYLVDAGENLDDYGPGTGNLVWQSLLGSAASYSTPALDTAHLVVANEIGCVYDFGSTSSQRPWPVTGVVRNVTGPAIPGAIVTVGGTFVLTDANGSFRIPLPNGSYVFEVEANGYLPSTVSAVVAGGLGPLTIRLTPLPTYPLRGVVVDGQSGHPLPDVVVQLEGPYGFVRSTTTAANGAFALAGPNGTDYLSVSPPAGYNGFATHVTVAGGLVEPLLLSLTPSGTSINRSDPGRLALFVPLLIVALAGLGLGAVTLKEERRRAGLPTTLLSPFGRYVLMRVLVIPAQATAVLTLLYIVGTFLPAVIHGADPCTLSAGACQSCQWSNWYCDASAFWNGWISFLGNLFTGQWGYAKYNNLQLPAVQFLDWWLPPSLELAFIALPLSAVIAYPLGLISGWRRDSVVDVGVRVSSLLGLLVPSFLVVLLLLGGIYLPFTSALGDTPYGLLPTPVWFSSHGGQPAWIGIGSNTSPTGFPLIDGAFHGDWTFETLVAAKTLLQAFAIAALYAAIYLRFARHAVAESAGAAYITAGRARGVRDSTLLWHHTGRRVLPIFVLIFGLTLPVYIGTQALVEAMFSDQGVGTLLLGEMTHVQSTAFGFASASQGFHVGNFYQVTIFLLVFVVLIGNLCADILARVLDPRSAGEEKG